MPIPPAAFRPGKIQFPSSSALLSPGCDECPRCRFTATLCLNKYPFLAPRLERLIDPEERFQSRDRRLLNRAADRFERHFPQTRVHVCATRLPQHADCREFGYWLFNISPPESSEDELRRYFSILIIVDRAHRSISATLGYGLDPFVDDGVLKHLLSQSLEDFQQGDYAQGIVHFLKVMEEHLRNEFREISESAAAWQDAQKRQASPAQAEHSTIPESACIVTEHA
jgi:hypothetical protein